MFAEGGDIKISFLCFVFFLLFIACNPSHHSTDIDTIVPDTETPIAEDDLAVVDNLSDEDSMLIDDTAVPDVDTVIDLSACDGPPTNDYLENTHTGNEDCPELSKAKFPYFDTDGKIHFCRKCDKVRADDPQCARNLWKEANCKLCKEKSEYDCCGYPCEMPGLTPKTYGEPDWYPMDECDVYLNANNPYGWTTGIETFKHFNVNEGKIGLRMDNVSVDLGQYRTESKAFEYDLQKKTYHARYAIHGDQMTYYKGAFLSMIPDLKEPKTLRYLMYSDEKAYQVAYNKTINFIVYTPALSDKWIFLILNETDGGPDLMLYAKIGKWQWTQLGEGIAYHPNIVGDKLAFYMDDFNGYVCDLSKTPQNLSDCIKVNRTGEQVRDTVLDEENNSLVYLTPVTPTDKLVKVDLSSRSLKYEDISITGNFPDTIGLAIDQVKGDFMLYADVYQYHIQDSDRDGRKCYYRISKKKSYCMLPLQFDMGDGLFMINRQSFAEFEGHFLVWMDTYGPQMVARNMECYCDKHPDLCPFDDYTPNPDNPKYVKTGERPNGKERQK